MSNPGKNPTISSNRFTPLNADPANAQDGDIFYASSSHGSKDEGLWVYQAGVWSQVSTSANLSVLASLTLTPQSADPGSPAVGMLFVSNGTPRAAGLWIYTSGGWNQITGVRYIDYAQKEPVVVRVATITNLNLASQLENGDVVDGVTLATGNIVLVKSQTSASENGVYVVAASGAPTRHSSADTAAELNNYVAYTTGTDSTTSAATTKNKFYFQTATLSSLSDPQTWSTTAPTFTFTTPAGVYMLSSEVTGGGGAGGGGAGSGVSGGDGGGAGTLPHRSLIAVTPGLALTITVGMGGLGPYYTATHAAGATGDDSSIVGTGVSIVGKGAAGGSPGVSTTGGAGGIPSTIPGMVQATGGAGGNNAANGSAGTTTIYATGGAGGALSGAGGGGGGGAAGLGAGAAGGAASVSFSLPVNSGAVPAASTGAGGGGAGYSSGGSSHGTGGHGGSGFVRIAW